MRVPIGKFVKSCLFYFFLSLSLPRRHPPHFSLKSFRRSLIFSMTENITRLDARGTNKSPSEGFRKMKYRQCRKAFSDLNFCPFFSLLPSPFVFVPMFSQDLIFLRSSVFRDFNSYVTYRFSLPRNIHVENEEGTSEIYCARLE